MREIRRILAEVPDLRILDLDEAGIAPSSEEEALEPYDTFEENARSKAEYFHRRSGLPTVADDSGIVVDALGGAPGVHSKRFAPAAGGADQDEANNRWLVERRRTGQLSSGQSSGSQRSVRHADDDHDRRADDRQHEPEPSLLYRYPR